MAQLKRECGSCGRRFRVRATALEQQTCDDCLRERWYGHKHGLLPADVIEVYAPEPYPNREQAVDTYLGEP